MKRLFTLLFALSLMFTAGSSYFTTDVYAAKDKKSAETSTEAVDTTDGEKETSATKASLPPTGAAYGVERFEDAPDTVAASAIVMDARSGIVLYGKEEETTRFPASITKIMTTLLAIENCNMDDIITFSNTAVYGIEEGSSSAGIPVGAELTVEETLYALMLVSANEAGAAIAEHVSGSNEEFAKLMTQRAKELGCTGTQFKNPHGLPDEEHYTTAHDMGRILQECVKHEEFRKISSTLTYTIDKRDTLPSSIDLVNHAKILRKKYPEYYYEYAVGSKTGFTHAALNTLVTFAEKDGTQLLCVILRDQGADCSYKDTKALFEWGFSKVKTINPFENFHIEEALSSDESLDSKKVDAWLKLDPQFNPDYPLLVNKSFEHDVFSTIFREDEDPKTGRLGYVDLKIEDEKVYSAPVTYDTSSAEAQTYLMKQGGDDNLKTADKEKKGSILRKFGIFLLRLVIACALVFIIMQMIHRWQSEKRRQDRIRARKKKHATGGNPPRNPSRPSSGVGSSSRTGSAGRTSSSNRTSSSGRSSSSRRNTPGSSRPGSSRPSSTTSTTRRNTSGRNTRPGNRKPR